MSKSLNRVQLIGNLTRDPELRYTPSGAAVCSFSIATNRQWSNDSGEKKEYVEYHRIVAWNKLAEICAQYLTKGRKTYVEGRLQTRKWQTQDGQDRTTTEIVISDMIILDSKGAGQPGDGGGDFDIPDSEIDTGTEDGDNSVNTASDKDKKEDSISAEDKKAKKGEDNKDSSESGKQDQDEDIPF